MVQQTVINIYLDYS